MIRDYKCHNVQGTFLDNGIIYLASKADKKFFLYMFEQFEPAEEYNFKMLKKFISPYVLGIIEEFVEKDVRYIVTDYAQSDLLKLQKSLPNYTFPLPTALEYFAKIVTIIEELHDGRIIYCNVRPQAMKVHNEQVYLNDFSMSQKVNRKERLYERVGCLQFWSPEFYSDDGYGFEADIWAAGVLLFYMLMNDYPFALKSPDEAQYMAEVKKKCENGYNFELQIKSKKNPGSIQPNKALNNFFRSIFELDYSKRISIEQIKTNELFSKFFTNKNPAILKDLLDEIDQQDMHASLLVTKFLDLKKFSISHQIQKQQLLLDFLAKCSQSLMLDGSKLISEQMILKSQFVVLKVALLQIKNLIDIFHGTKQPEFGLGSHYNPNEWAQIRESSAFQKVVKQTKKQQGILTMMFNSAYKQIQSQNDSSFTEDIPENFVQIKIMYRKILSEVYQICRLANKNIVQDRPMRRKIAELSTRIIILYYINHMFRANVSEDFQEYRIWNKGRENLQNLDEWIHNEKQTNLKKFVLRIYSKYK